MVVDFAITCSLVRPGRPRYPVLVHRAAVLLHASFRPRLAATPLRFANPSPPSGRVKDFHLQAVDHARHTSQRVRPSAGPMTGSACPRLSRLSGSSVRPRGHGATRLCPPYGLKAHRSMHRLDADATDESVERRFRWPLPQRHRRNRLHFTLQYQAKEPGFIEQARDVSSAASMADQRNGQSKE
jgi:hypothetical protein